MIFSFVSIMSVSCFSVEPAPAPAAALAEVAVESWRVRLGEGAAAEAGPPCACEAAAADEPAVPPDPATPITMFVTTAPTPPNDRIRFVPFAIRVHDTHPIYSYKYSYDTSVQASCDS